VHCVANPMISSVLINFVFDLHHRSFVLRPALFFVTTPRRDSAATAVVSDTHRRRLLWLRDAPPLPSDLLQPARRRLDLSAAAPCALFRFDRFGVALHRPDSAKPSASAQRFSSGPEPQGHAVPLKLSCTGRWVLEPTGHVPAPELP
jgi:hypothetical protein